MLFYLFAVDHRFLVHKMINDRFPELILITCITGDFHYGKGPDLRCPWLTKYKLTRRIKTG